MITADIEDFREHFADYARKARNEDDLIRLDVPEGAQQMYVVATHAGVNEVLKNENHYFVHFADYFNSIPNKTEVDQEIANIFAVNLGNDDPIHNELRKDIRNHFNGSAVDQHGSFIQQCASQLCDELEKKARENNGEVDFLEDFAKPLTFLITSYVCGLEFVDEEDKRVQIELANEAINIVRLLATDEEKVVALDAHNKLAELIEPQLHRFIESLEKDARKDCLLYDFASKIAAGETHKLQSFIEIVLGLFMAGLGASSMFLCVCLDFLLKGDAANDPKDLQAYYLDPEKNVEDRREAIFEVIRIVQGKLGGLLPRYSPKGGEVMGNPVKEESLVFMSFVSANQDEKAFVDPPKFLPKRQKVPEGLSKEEISERRALRKEKNISFSYGEHMCPGKRISLVLLQIAYDELFKRFPNMEVIDLDVISEILGRPTEVLSFRLNLNLD
jgi:cytochrome P450